MNFWSSRALCSAHAGEVVLCLRPFRPDALVYCCMMQVWYCVFPLSVVMFGFVLGRRMESRGGESVDVAMGCDALASRFFHFLATRIARPAPRSKNVS